MKNTTAKKVEYKIINIISTQDQTELAEIINKKISNLITVDLSQSRYDKTASCVLGKSSSTSCSPNQRFGQLSEKELSSGGRLC